MNIGIWRTKSNPFQKPPLPKWLIEWSIKQTLSMTQASKLIGCSYGCFRKWSKLYGLWNPNQPGKGISKKKSKDIQKRWLEITQQ